MFDTSKDSAYEDNNDYKPGNIYHINPHSVVVMTCRREEKSQEKEFLNIALKQIER